MKKKENRLDVFIKAVCSKEEAINLLNNKIMIMEIEKDAKLAFKPKWLKFAEKKNWRYFRYKRNPPSRKPA